MTSLKEGPKHVRKDSSVHVGVLQGFGRQVVLGDIITLQHRIHD